MKRLSLLLVSILLVAFVSGCVSTESPGVSPTAPTDTSKSSTGTTATVAPEPKFYTAEELLERMRNIEQFTYFENTSLKLTLSVREENATQEENVTVVYRKTGYVDLKDMEAAVNITTITFPGGASMFSRL